MSAFEALVRNCFSAVLSHLLSVPQDEKSESALIAIASVAAVIWTGGIISIQLNEQRARVKAVVGMEYLQFAFLAPCCSLIASGLPLRCISILAGLAYLVSAFRKLHQASLASRLLKVGSLRLSDGTPIQPIQSNLRYYAIWALLALPLYAYIAAEPIQEAVAWSSVVAILAGIRLILIFLHGGDSASDPS